jgi:Ca2+-binding EF-hand superfamily protein
MLGTSLKTVHAAGARTAGSLLFCSCCCRRRASRDPCSVVPIPTSPVEAGYEKYGPGDDEDTVPELGRKESQAGGNLSRKESSAMDRSASRVGAVGKPFPKRPMACKLSQAVWDKLEELFRKMDPDGSNAVTRDEARLFFKGAFGKVSADAMFNEVDIDGSGAIDADEFAQFWIHVKKSGYKEQDILEELDELLEGAAWRDWKDGRNTAVGVNLAFPKRPMLCRLSAKTWSKCQELFEKIDHDKTFIITEEKAAKHFQGAFSKVSVDAMFNEVDCNHHGQITTKEWMKFWVQVKSNGYKQQDILDEIESLLEGNAWVDWKDGRSTT